MEYLKYNYQNMIIYRNMLFFLLVATEYCNKLKLLVIPVKNTKCRSKLLNFMQKSKFPISLTETISTII